MFKWSLNEGLLLARHISKWSPRLRCNVSIPSGGNYGNSRLFLPPTLVTS